MNFKDWLMTESSKEQTALDFLTSIVQNSPYRGRVFLAGGAVRDMELGKNPKDLDVVVTGGINAGIEFATWLAMQIGNYKDGSNPVVYPTFGTAKVFLNGVKHNGVDLSGIDIEAVATRKEKYFAGSRKPEVSAGDLSDDVNRRDFTVNSLLKDLTTGEILDLTGLGRADIKRGLIRTPLDPDVIFAEDPLRLLRAVRFATKYSWDLPLFMLRSMRKNATKLANISAERIRDELDKMLLTDYPDKAIKLLKITNIMNFVLPEFEPAINMTQNQHHKQGKAGTVFGHTLEVLSKTKPVLLQRLIGLFHDIGKTLTRSVTPTGVHFYDHEDIGADMTTKIMQRLKYPNELIDAVVMGVKNHMRLKSGGDSAVSLSDKSLRKFKIEIGDNLENILDVIHADNISHADHASMPNQIDSIRKRLKDLQVVQEKPNLPIDGNDLIALGFKPGPKFKEILSAVTDKWFENPNITRDEAMEIVKAFRS